VGIYSRAIELGLGEGQGGKMKTKKRKKRKRRKKKEKEKEEEEEKEEGRKEEEEENFLVEKNLARVLLVLRCQDYLCGNHLCKKVEGWFHQASFNDERSLSSVFTRATKLVHPRKDKEEE